MYPSLVAKNVAAKGYTALHCIVYAGDSTTTYYPQEIHNNSTLIKIYFIYLHITFVYYKKGTQYREGEKMVTTEFFN